MMDYYFFYDYDYSINGLISLLSIFFNYLFSVSMILKALLTDVNLF